MSDRVRHIISLSGGKDSTALAIFLRDQIPDAEYIFCDTRNELPETYEYLDRVEAYLGKPILRLVDQRRDFDHWLDIYGGYLPSSRMRWCTKHLKLQPFEKHVGDDTVVSYIAIRADEDRAGYLSTKPNITTRYPFKEDGITRADVHKILIESGLGYPSYYSWRSRSGCYFCFFQQRIEWVGLMERHKDLFEKAVSYEKTLADGKRFTWIPDLSLQELRNDGKTAEIKTEHQKRMALERGRRRKNAALVDVLDDDEAFWGMLEAYQTESPCVACK